MENGWEKYQVYVLARMKSIDDELKELNARLRNVEAKSTIWGGISGFLAALGTILAGFLIK